MTPLTIKNLFFFDRPENFTGKFVVVKDGLLDAGDTLYFKDGFLHREDGPAIIFAKLDAVGYCINGYKCSKKAHDLLVLFMKLKGITCL